MKWKELIDENCDYVDGSPIPCYLGSIIIIQNVFILHLIELITYICVKIDIKIKNLKW